MKLCHRQLHLYIATYLQSCPVDILQHYKMVTQLHAAFTLTTVAHMPESVDLMSGTTSDEALHLLGLFTGCRSPEHLVNLSCYAEVAEEVPGKQCGQPDGAV